MKKIYSLALGCFFISTAFAQNVSKQNKTPLESNKINSHHAKDLQLPAPPPTFIKEKGLGGHDCKSHDLTKKYYESIGKWDQFNLDYQNAVSKLKPVDQTKTPGTNTIAIIFHVVHNPNNPAENVSYANIMSVYNDIVEDYQLLNSDASQARSQFGFVPADANINFCLATKTPTGTPLTEVGVIRVSTTEDYYNPDTEENKMKASATGGSQIWDRNQYLNVWICDITNGAQSGTAGYAYRPSTTMLPPSNIDGIVIDYNLGVNNDNILTHEIGHYLGLDHTWGGSGGCSNDDGFTDTPNTAGPSFNYSGSCSGNQTTCTVQTQYENYMDYSNCTVMFTQNQSDYMLTILTGIRASLLSSPGCDPVNAPPVANFTADITSPIVIPVGGAVNFTDLSTNVPTSWLWNFGGGAANSSLQNPSITFNTIGTYTVSLTATNAYGNDSEVKNAYVQVVAAAAGSACDTLRNYNPTTEDFAYYNWTSPGSGFFPGTGKLGAANTTRTYFVADRYTAPTTTQVRRLRFPIFTAVDQTGTGMMKIRVHGETAGNPGTILTTDTLYIADMNEGYFNEFDFTTPASVTGNFWVSFEFFYGSPQDSIALGCVDMDYRNGTIATGPSTAKVYYGGTTNSNGTWHPTTDINAVIKTSLWLDVMTSNGPAPTADFTLSEDNVCVGGQITVNGSSSTNTTNYYWYMTDNPFTTIYQQSSNAGTTFTFPAAGPRSIYLFADGACLTDAVVYNFSVNALPNATVTPTNTTCGLNNGAITFTSPTGGAGAPYSYSIDGTNWQAIGTFSNLPAGTYTVYIKSDGDNCDRSFSRVVGTSTALSPTVSASQTICDGQSATLTASGGTSYEWFDGSTSIGTTATINVTPTASVQYTCVVSDGTCEATVMTNVTVNQCSSIDELAQQVKLYPNPTSSDLTIQLPGEFEFELLDARGRLVNSGKALDQTIIDIEKCNAGVYILNVKNTAFQHSFRIFKN
ncbi:MAG: PKD domain-containing protein [Bacteroidia bacterium]|nr:MAG: PKD domain-containing protein [Bacteroidia bacterium]